MIINFEDFIKENNDLIWSIVNNTKRQFYSHNFQKYLYSKFEKEEIYQELLTKIHEVYCTFNKSKNAKMTTYFTNICIKHLQTLMQPYGAKKRQLKVITNVDLKWIIDDDYNENTMYDELTLREVITGIGNIRNRDIIFYMLNGETQVNIARKYGISKQRVQQIWKEFLNSIKERER